MQQIDRSRRELCRVPVRSVLRGELLMCHQRESDPDQTLTLQNDDSICWINGKFLLTAETYFIYLNVIPVPLVFRGSGKVGFLATSCLTSQNASLKLVSQLTAQMLSMIPIATYKKQCSPKVRDVVHHLLFDFFPNPSIFLRNLRFVS